MHANPHRFRHTFTTWAIEKEARELDGQYLLRRSTSAMVRRYAATEDAAKATALPAVCGATDCRLVKLVLTPGPDPDRMRLFGHSQQRRERRLEEEAGDG